MTDFNSSSKIWNIEVPSKVRQELTLFNCVCQRTCSHRFPISNSFSVTILSPKWRLTCGCTSQQESTPVGYVPPALVNHTCFSSHQMSALVGEGSSSEKFKQFFYLGHQMSLLGVNWGQGWGSL